MRNPTRQKDLIPPRGSSALPKKERFLEEGRDLYKQMQEKSLRGGIHLGHQSLGSNSPRVWSREMSEHLLGVRNNVCLFNTTSTLHHTLKGVYIITLLLRRGGKVLILSNNRELQGFLSVKEGGLREKNARLYNPSFSQRGSKKGDRGGEHLSFSEGGWRGGTLSNWQQISKRVWNFANFKQQFERFYKENRISLSRYKRSSTAFKGLLGKGIPKEMELDGNSLKLVFKQRPDLVLALNSDESGNLLREAFRLKIPVVAVSDSHSNLKNTLYTVPGNSESRHILSLLASLLIRSRQYVFVNL